MTVRGRPRNRRGVVMAEAGIVYSVAILLLMGIVVAGLGVFRYQEVTFQARQAARWASVQSATPSSSSVISNGMTLVSLAPANLSASVSTSTINSVSYITVTLTYRWTPEAFPSVISPVTFTSTSTQPVSR